MGIADVFFWIFLTAVAVLFSLGWIAISLFSGKQSGETIFVAFVSVVCWFLSYNFWPFQVAMKAAQ